jgi:hypothetical protein
MRLAIYFHRRILPSLRWIIQIPRLITMICIRHNLRYVKVLQEYELLIKREKVQIKRLDIVCTGIRL